MAGGRWWEEGGGGGPLQVFKFWFSNIIFSLPLFVERSNLHIMQMMFFLHVRGNNLLDRGFPNNVLGTSLHKEREMRWMIMARPLKREEGTGHTNLICVQCAVVCTSQSNYASPSDDLMITLVTILIIHLWTANNRGVHLPAWLCICSNPLCQGGPFSSHHHSHHLMVHLVQVGTSNPLRQGLPFSSPPF